MVFFFLQFLLNLRQVLQCYLRIDIKLYNSTYKKKRKEKKKRNNNNKKYMYIIITTTTITKKMPANFNKPMCINYYKVH